jgi:hypothetical protein
MDVPHKHNIEQKESDTKKYLLYDFTYMKSRNINHTWHFAEGVGLRPGGRGTPGIWVLTGFYKFVLGCLVGGNLMTVLFKICWPFCIFAVVQLVKEFIWIKNRMQN